MAKPSRKTREEVSEGIHKLMGGYQRTGTIKTSRATYHPESKAAAAKQASAIEYGKHGIGRTGRKRRRARPVSS